jgi:hypothetical protein
VLGAQPEEAFERAVTHRGEEAMPPGD